MMVCRFFSFFILLLSLPSFAHTIQGLGQKDADEAIKKFLLSQNSETESAETQDTAIADLNGDGKSELVLVWTLMGPTYSNNTLTIFSRSAQGYTPVASLPLMGQASLLSVKNGIILVEQKTLAKNDPLCCPSIKRLARYRWAGKKISAVKK
jgi:hypothetical protein